MKEELCPVFVFISGTGNTFKYIIDNCKNIDIKYLLTNNPTAPGITFANDANIPALVVPIVSSIDYITALYTMMIRTGIPKFIILAGFMRILPKRFIDYAHNLGIKIINIHPSLLPKYKGLNTHQRVIDAGEKDHGVTIHYVNADLDAGEIISQISVPIGDDDTAQTLSSRVKEVESWFYPHWIDRLAVSSDEI